LIDPDKRASTALKIESFGREGEDPRALTSEGHQDSLGLCIFLAFVKKFNKNCPLVILDDVVTTIDAQHRSSICELLSDEFNDHQLIITTHDEVWYEQLCSHQRAIGISGNCMNLKITRWSTQTGPIISPYKPRWERIQEKINSSDKQGAGNEGRQYLEWVLKEICKTTIAPLPLKEPPLYTVAELLAPAKKRIEELIADNNTKKEILQRFRKLEEQTIMGNILSHDNPLAESVSIIEVEQFCHSIRNIHYIFSCLECESLLKYYQDIKRLKCPNSKCKCPTEIVCQ
ncbi:MAG: hypothetical protein H3Z52_14355, partial [archaeon]|nr:hypothetical protein [archaeon]